MCCTPLYTNKHKNTTQYVLDTTIHKTQDEENQSKIHNTIFVGHHHTQDTRPRKTNKKHTNICVGHNHTQDTRRRQTKQKNTTQYLLDTTIHRTQDEDKQNKIHNTICVGHNHTQDTRPRQTKQKYTTQYVLDTTMRKQTQMT